MKRIIVSASLTPQTYAIWEKLPKRSAWVRQALLREGQRLGIREDEHLGSGSHLKDGKIIPLCNPRLIHGLCLMCYPDGVVDDV